MALGSIFRKVSAAARHAGLKLNHGFNRAKDFVRRHTPKVRQVAGMVKEAMRYFDDLPYVGEVARNVGKVSSAVQLGTEYVNRGLDTVEKWQTHVGVPTRTFTHTNPHRRSVAVAV